MAQSAKTLRIMQLCGSPDAGGAEAFFLRLTRALHHIDQTEVIAVVRQGSWLASRLSAEHIPHHTAAFGGRFDLLTRGRISGLMRSLKPHVAQSWMNRASRFMPRGLCCTLGRLGGYYDLKYYQGIDHLIGNTQDICRYIREEGWPAERTHYIPNFVDLPAEGFKLEGDAVRAHYRIPHEAVTLLFAGRLHPVKGADVLLEALAQLPAHVHVLMAGAGDEDAALKEQTAKLGITDRVHFAGWVNDITPLCAAADIFVVPSRCEPLGNVILEAWAHAMPLISSKAEGPLQLISDRENGLLVPIDDATALANAVNEILGNPNLAVLLAEGGLYTLQQKFSEDSVLQQYLDFYHRVAEDTACAV